MQKTEKTETVHTFNNCINSRDLEGLVDLMTDDHIFADSAGNSVSGRDGVADAWRGFFEAFPDYRNVFEDLTVNGDIVVITGYSVCSDKRLEGRAIWTAKVVSGRISEWRVHEDTPENRILLAPKASS